MAYAFVAMAVGMLFFVILGGIMSFIGTIENMEAKKK